MGWYYVKAPDNTQKYKEGKAARTPLLNIHLTYGPREILIGKRETCQRQRMEVR